MPLSSIFAGVAIHVNGLTQPSWQVCPPACTAWQRQCSSFPAAPIPDHKHTLQELKQIMVMHGGRFENYFYRPPVTHVICSNLPDTKLKQMAKERCV